MLETSHQIILGGEISETTPQWNITGQAAHDECFKLYIPIAGQAQIQLNGEGKTIAPPHLYLLNATKLEAQTYQQRFHHVWIHFIPASLRLRHLLFHQFTYAQWDCETLPNTNTLIQGIRELKAKKEALKRQKTKNTSIPWAVHLASDGFMLKIQGFLNEVLSEVLITQNIHLSTQEQSILEKLRPAIDFMETNYRDNPSLDSIAAQVAMAPSYFHRLFVKHFTLSPHQYMMRKRLSEARTLLRNTTQSVKQIALTCGYNNAFYFSKVFKQELHITPSQFRNMTGMS